MNRESQTGLSRKDVILIGVVSKGSGRGSKVDTLPVISDTTVLDDIVYFQRKLLISMAVPLTYLESFSNA